MVQAVVTEEQWLAYGQANARRTGAEAARLLPWMLDGANERAVAKLLEQLPEPLRATYRDAWQPAYAALDLWGA